MQDTEKEENSERIGVEIITPDGVTISAKPTFWERFIAPLGILGVLLLLAYGLAQLYAGYLGIEYYWGVGWAVGLLILMLIMRISLPITVGSYFGAVDVWGWDWYWGLLFAVPGLVLFGLYFVIAILKKDE